MLRASSPTPFFRFRPEVNPYHPTPYGNLRRSRTATAAFHFLGALLKKSCGAPRGDLQCPVGGGWPSSVMRPAGA